MTAARNRRFDSSPAFTKADPDLDTRIRRNVPPVVIGDLDAPRRAGRCTVDILVDEHPYRPAGGSEQTVGELANEVTCVSLDAPRMVVSVRCDGEPVSQENLDQILAQPLSDFAKLTNITPE